MVRLELTASIARFPQAIRSRASLERESLGQRRRGLAAVAEADGKGTTGRLLSATTYMIRFTILPAGGTAVNSTLGTADR